ncbi:hypothetical protein [Sinobaca sp. H24]|uniref:hypothetical protein n=1 Tax=Sinobaca sp. H24 TaxID=2923376 RepID=UPI00207A3861|nr:hypothetical protein [Sinobaca sp. H24]
MVEMEIGCDYPSRAHQEGVEEYVFVQDGSICIEVDQEKHGLHAQDAIRFKQINRIVMLTPEVQKPSLRW